MTSSDSHKPAYAVGYGRPPVDSQFKPGKSGNPSGRPKERRSFKSDLVAALDAMTDADGKATNQQRLACKLVNDALAGDPLALKIVAQIALQLDHEEGHAEDVLTPEDQKLLEDFSRREQLTDSTTASPEDLDHE